VSALAPVLAAGALLAAPGPAAPPAPAGTALAGLSLRELAGQRIIAGYTGTRIPATLLARVRRGEVGGIIVFAGNIRSRAALAAELRRLQRARRPVRAPLLTMIDQEGGLVKRLPGAPSGSAAQMGRRGTAAVRREGRATAANLRRARVNVNLAPVMDLGRPGSYQRATGRAFARRPGPVGRLGSAFAAGLQRGGVAATLKHFPGLGGVPGDEDARIQTVPYRRATLRRADIAPFAAGIRAGARLVMTSTARYPALDRGPALLSRRITTGELRGRLGFRGVTITDDLDVTALRALGPRRLGVRATAAGNDLLLYARSPRHAALGLDALVGAVRAGDLSRRELEASVRRILALRAQLS
jgi:beta-N-acetylhexosaminidase